jgi:hypothetical protein
MVPDAVTHGHTGSKNARNDKQREHDSTKSILRATQYDTTSGLFMTVGLASPIAEEKCGG